MEGISGISPVIKKIEFVFRGKIAVLLEDGRKIIVPLSFFPSIKKLNEIQRKKWYIIDDQMFSFDECNEIFHIEQILGKEVEYRYQFSAV
jgi:hypothetical protein